MLLIKQMVPKIVAQSNHDLTHLGVIAYTFELFHHLLARCIAVTHDATQYPLHGDGRMAPKTRKSLLSWQKDARIMSSNKRSLSNLQCRNVADELTTFALQLLPSVCAMNNSMGKPDTEDNLQRMRQTRKPLSIDVFSTGSLTGNSDNPPFDHAFHLQLMESTMA